MLLGHRKLRQIYKILSEKFVKPSRGSRSTSRSSRNSSRSSRSEEPSTQQEPSSHQEARNEQEQPVQSSRERNNTTSPESYRRKKRRSSDSTSTDSSSSSSSPDKRRKKRKRSRSRNSGRRSTGCEDTGILKDTLVTLTTKLNDLTKNIDDENRSSVESTDWLNKNIKQIKKAPEFKHKYNKAQYDLNHNIIESLEDISDLLSKNKVEAAEKKLEEAIVKLKKRNKLIKLADKSQAGWYFAEEYETDNLASDSEDEKKIKRAECLAMATRKLIPSTSTFSSLNHLFRPQRSGTEAFTQQNLRQELPTGRISKETDVLGVENLDVGEGNAEPSRISMLTPNLFSQRSCRVYKTNNRTLHQQNSKTKKSSSLKSIEDEYNLDSFQVDRDKFFVENERF